jgi:hypothetical protein
MRDIMLIGAWETFQIHPMAFQPCLTATLTKKYFLINFNAFRLKYNLNCNQAYTINPFRCGPKTGTVVDRYR